VHVTPIAQADILDRYKITIAALPAALIVTQRLPFLGLFRTVYFLPAAISQVVTGLVFLWLFDEIFGLLNHQLGYLGLGPLRWQADACYLLLALTLAAESYNLLIFTAALRNVPRARQEAAALTVCGPIVWMLGQAADYRAIHRAAAVVRRRPVKCRLGLGALTPTCVGTTYTGPGRNYAYMPPVAVVRSFRGHGPCGRRRDG
jgi:hypothetical protein